MLSHPWFLSFVLSLFLGFLSLASAQTVIQNLSDSGPGSLREAIDNAVDDEVITFDASLSGGTISLTSGNLYIRDNITIDGSPLPRAVKIDPAGISRIFRISTGKVVILKTLELANGKDDNGGAILNKGPLTMENCTLHSNTATELGGGIYSTGDFSELSLTNCTIVRNHAEESAGAIYLYGTSADLKHCTITENTALRNEYNPWRETVGGIGGNRVIQDSQSAPQYLLSNCVVAGNGGRGRPEFSDSFRPSNIAFDSIAPNPGSINLIDQSPLFTSLGDYGGPIATVMPLAGSPAINAGANLSVGLDQRGGSRSLNGSPDLGAVEAGAIAESEVAPLVNPVVTSLEDELFSSHLGLGLTLREAISRATVGSTITFAPELSGQSINLEHSSLRVSRELSINASSLPHPLTISAGDRVRNLIIFPEASVTLTSLIISDGSAPNTHGGGILNFGTLQLDQCTIEDCAAGYGGGLSNWYGATCLVESSIIQNNSATQAGGGARLTGNQTVQNSLIVGNSAGGIGGGLDLLERKLYLPTLANCTIAGNTAIQSGGGVSGKDFQIIESCTIVNNSAGEYGGISNISARLQSSINAGNSSPNGPGNASTQPGNLIDSDPMLSPLQDNGGPTPTMIPLVGSPVIDPPDNTAVGFLKTDQRGYLREVGSSRDFGAVEFASVPAPAPIIDPVVTNPNDLFRKTSAPDLADLTLREALAFAAPGSIVSFSDSLGKTTISLQRGQLWSSTDLTINGAHPEGPITITAELNSRHLVVSLSQSLTLRNLRFVDGLDSSDEYADLGSGGSIHALGNLEVENCQFVNCRSHQYGGAIYQGASLNIIDSTIENCRGDRGGGAIYSFHLGEGDVNIMGCQFLENSSREAGALLLRDSPQVTITDCFFWRNRSPSEAGAIISSVYLKISNTTFAENIGYDGRTLSAFDPPEATDSRPGLTLQNCTFTSATAVRFFPRNPGILSLSNTSAEVTHCTFVGRSSPADAGIRITNSSLILKNSIITKMSTTSDSEIVGELDPASDGNLIGPGANLAPLTNYGGRWQSIVPLENSPALNIGIDTSLTLDARGLPRSAGTAPDAGATERQEAPATEPTTIEEAMVSRSDDSSAPILDPDNLSLRDAVSIIRAGGTIKFSPDLETAELSLSQGAIVIERNLTIDASALSTTFQINDPINGRLFLIPEGVSAEFLNLSLSNNDNPQRPTAGVPGPLVEVSGQLSLTSCLVEKNFALSVFIVDGILSCAKSQFRLNTSRDGVIFLRTAAQGEIQTSTFENNFQYGSGSTISGWPDSDLIVENCTFLGNESPSGGAISTPGTCLINQSTIIKNKASSQGGGVNIFGTGLTIKNSIIALNEAPTSPNLNATEFTETGPNFLTGDPKLTPLAYYGGETKTMVPFPGSPVIDAGENPNLTMDQRGEDRVNGSAVDLGSTEFGQRPDLEPSLIIDPIVTRPDDLLQIPLDPNNLSLREAAIFATEGSTISFSSNFPDSPIILTRGELDLDRNINIDASGPDHPVILSAQKAHRLLRVRPGVTANLTALTLTEGSADLGGCILNEGSLNIDHCQLRNNEAEIAGSAIESTAGSSLVIGSSSFNQNNASPGGRSVETVRSYGDLNISSSTFNYNGSGYAISSIGNTATLNQVTVARNARGLSSLSANITVRFSTFAANSSSDFSLSRGTQIVDSSIIMRTSGAANPEILQDATGDGLSLVTTELVLWPLADYGGPTLTMPPLPGSPIVDAGGVTALTMDQRGANRIIGAAPDLGATEKGAIPGLELEFQQSPIVTLAANRFNPAMILGNEGLSLREAVAIATPGSVIQFDPALSGLDLDASLSTSVGKELTFSGANFSGIFDVPIWLYLVSGAQVTVEDFVIRGSPFLIGTELADVSLYMKNLDVSGRGFSLNSGGTTIIDRCDFKDIKSPEISTIFRFSGSVEIKNSSFIGNQADSSIIGGFGTTESTITNCRFIRNVVGAQAYSVVDLSSGSLAIDSSEFAYNQSANQGGALRIRPVTGVNVTSISRCTFHSNQASQGGAIFIGGPSKVSIDRSTFSGNSAGAGGGIYNDDSIGDDPGRGLTLNHVTISGNQAERGGGIVNWGHLSSTNSIIAGNQSAVTTDIDQQEVFYNNGGNLISIDPQLLPLGDYGGPHLTMPPRLGSPAIDTASGSNSPDQRSLPISTNNLADIGAVEFQGAEAELLFTFDLDTDRDGMSNGLEIATGRNPFVAGDSPDLDLKILAAGMISTGFDPASADSIIFKVTRSQDLLNFETILLSNESTPLTSEDGLILLEDPTPLQKSFYRIEVSPR